MRVESSGVSYSNFKEYAAAQGIETKERIQEASKVAEKQNKFLTHHKCKACGQFMIKEFGSNLMICKNESCRGIKQVKKDKEGNEIVSYLPSYEILEDKWADYATYLFD